MWDIITLKIFYVIKEFLKMAELRFNPLTKDWVMIASHRQNRPQMPKDWCPF